MTESDCADQNSKEFQKQLWRAIYEQEHVASRMVEIAAKKEGITFEIEAYGTIQLLVKPASAVGDNYMSDTYYNTIVLNNGGEEQKAFVKILPNNPLLRMGAESMKVYDREIASYCHFHPLLRQIRDKAGLTAEDLPLSVPEIYFTNLEESQAIGEGKSSTVLVMEELCSQSFKMTDKSVGGSKEEVELTLSTLANYHALSLMLLRQYKNADGTVSLPESIQYAVGNVGMCQMFQKLALKSAEDCILVLRHLDYKEASDWLQEQMQHLEGIFSLMDPSIAGPLTCFAHGDCWNNNILYRYDDSTGKVVEARLIDWQILLLSGPGRDVYHFLTSSTTPEMRKEIGKQLIDHYVDSLMSALEKLGLSLADEGFDRQFVTAEVEKFKLFGMFSGTLFLPVLVDGSYGSKVEELGNGVSTVASAEESGDVFSASLDCMTLETVLANKLLCHRLIELVLETKEALQ